MFGNKIQKLFKVLLALYDLWIVRIADTLEIAAFIDKVRHADCQILIH